MDFKTVADDFILNSRLQTQMTLPMNRENVLHFFDAVQRVFPTMTTFYQREQDCFVLESDRKKGAYSVISINEKSIETTSFNPADLESGHYFHRWVLEKCVYYFGISPLDIALLDVGFSFNLDYAGNRNQVVADALLGDSDLNSLPVDWDLARPVDYEPQIAYSLDEEGYRLAMLEVEPCCDIYQVRTGKFDEEPITINFVVRQYPKPDKTIETLNSYAYQSQICELLCIKNVIPRIVVPISQTIATRG